MAFLGTFAATGKSTSRSEPRNTSAPGREILRLGFFNSRLIICINFCDTILTNNEYLVTVIRVSEEEQVVCAICYDFCFYKIKSTIDNCAYKGNHFSEIDQSLFSEFCK